MFSTSTALLACTLNKLIKWQSSRRRKAHIKGEVGLGATLTCMQSSCSESPSWVWGTRAPSLASAHTCGRGILESTAEGQGLGQTLGGLWGGGRDTPATGNPPLWRRKQQGRGVGLEMTSLWGGSVRDNMVQHIQLFTSSIVSIVNS